MSDPAKLPYLLTVDEVAELLRTTRSGIYTRVERGLIPGVVRDGRRVLFLREKVLEYLQRAASPGATRR